MVHRNEPRNARCKAETHRSRSTAIVLSGTDGDGAIGIKRIKEVGGITVAHKPEEAQHDGMPRSAIETGMVDWVLPVQKCHGDCLRICAKAQAKSTEARWLLWILVERTIEQEGLVAPLFRGHIHLLPADLPRGFATTGPPTENIHGEREGVGSPQRAAEIERSPLRQATPRTFSHEM
jgi:hypothetical protein